MYTQCPECGTAFRVTAEVLKVAAGKVRCGGCANAFNALEYLSEEMPEQKSAAPEAEPQLPELTPEPLKPDGDDLPESISAEQSAALLKTLDELAGSDIRIEDTGVEWRLMDDDDDVDADAVDEVLEDSPTPVDEFLTSTPEVVDAPEIFEEPADAPAQPPVEELRFDDNTPLPEDFGFEDEPAACAPIVELEPEPEAEAEPAAPQPDITLSDPHEWTDILDEFEELAGEVARPLDAELDALLDEDAEGEAETDDDEVEEEEYVEAEDDSDEEAAEDFEDELEDEAEDDVDLEDEDLDVIDDDPQLDLIEEPEVEEHDIEAELAMIDDGDEDEDDADDNGGHYVPPMSEEEQTVNMQIDQELFAIAVEDEDGFASTIVIPEDMTPEKALESDTDDADDVELDDDDAEDTSDDDEVAAKSESEDPDAGFETIIMEGADVKRALDEEKRAADVAEAAELQEIAKAAEAEAAKNAGTNRYGLIAGIVVLVLLLIVQVVHQSREALATNAVFNNTFGPIYRALGNPLQPSWDITGWQFEATRGSAEIEAEDNSTETSETLTVYSRIGNKSEGALPYPLIRISLTDRFMEPLGSHILEPNDYLGDSMDPRKLVEPGDSFEAAITVESGAADASNFRLDVCYRHTDHQLRCKDDNFK